MKILVKIPSELEFVSRYIVGLVFEGLWKLDVEIKIHEEGHYKLENSENGSSLIFPAYFVLKEREKWMVERNAEDWGLDFFHFFEEKRFPVLFNGNISQRENKLNIDFFGTLFFLLNRYHEKVERLDQDDHSRNIADQTFLVRNNLIHKPIADLYLKKFSEIVNTFLGISIQTLSTYEVLPSHDVDRPFEYLYYTPQKLAKRFTGDILKRKSLSKAVSRINKYKKVKKGELKQDPYNTFNWIMDVSEKNNRTSEFHFIAASTNDKYDQDYSIVNSEIKNLMRKIYDRGHKIALHPSYEATDITGQIETEFKALQNVVSDLGIQQDVWKSRNHFLRWNTDCLSELEKAGVNTDQTLGFASQPGFRCGTCTPFYPFNYKENRMATVLFEPLILMEVGLFDESYLGLANNLSDAWNLALELKQATKEFNGKFTILWHNNHLVDEEMKSFYEQCIS